MPSVATLNVLLLTLTVSAVHALAFMSAASRLYVVVVDGVKVAVCPETTSVVGLAQFPSRSMPSWAKGLLEEKATATESPTLIDTGFCENEMAVPGFPSHCALIVT